MDNRLVKFIINPKSGFGRWVEMEIGLIEKYLETSSYRVGFSVTKRRGEGEEIARRCAEQGYFMVVAIGGDGTINEIARGLIGSSTVLGVIPRGSGNGFARSLKIPWTLKGACSVLVDGNMKNIDVGYIGGKPFFNTAGFGFDAAIGWEYNRKPRKFRGPVPYFLIGSREFFSLKREKVVIQIDKEEYSCLALLVTLANGREYGSGIVISPDADPSDGKLDLCVIEDIKFVKGLYYLPFLFSGKISRVPEYHRFRVAVAKISRERPGPIHLDGDPEMAGEELKVEVKPGGLTVRAP
jgi:diacylglycerol kinase (ATP)